MIQRQHGTASINDRRDSVEPTDNTPQRLQPGLWKDKLPPDWDAHFDDLDEELIRLFEGEDDGEDWSDVAPKRS
jgi:hypothetical protein